MGNTKQVSNKIKQLLLDKHKADFRIDMAVSILDLMLSDKKITKDYYWFTLGLLYAKGYDGILDFREDVKALDTLKNIITKEEEK